MWGRIPLSVPSPQALSSLLPCLFFNPSTSSDFSLGVMTAVLCQKSPYLQRKTKPFEVRSAGFTRILAQCLYLPLRLFGLNLR